MAIGWVCNLPSLVVIIALYQTLISRSDLECRGDEESLEDCPGIRRTNWPFTTPHKSSFQTLHCFRIFLSFLIPGKENPSCARGEVAGVICGKHKSGNEPDFSLSQFYFQTARYILGPQPSPLWHPLHQKVNSFQSKAISNSFVWLCMD